MAEQFFIKRGEKINGPFSVEKLQGLKKAKKLKADDEISESAEGPWNSIAAYYKAKQRVEQPSPSPAESSPKTVACEDYGGIVSRRAHQCPHCGAPIGQSERIKRIKRATDLTASETLVIRVLLDFIGNNATGWSRLNRVIGRQQARIACRPAPCRRSSASEQAGM
jgi:hypothetical protein